MLGMFPYKVQGEEVENILNHHSNIASEANYLQTAKQYLKIGRGNKYTKQKELKNTRLLLYDETCNVRLYRMQGHDRTTEDNNTRSRNMKNLWWYHMVFSLGRMDLNSRSIVSAQTGVEENTLLSKRGKNEAEKRQVTAENRRCEAGQREAKSRGKAESDTGGGRHAAFDGSPARTL
ncbi:hypothetical protein KIL84_000977 [Mauremys mutica]|uniref:Uncharacterized protein n=1 Tax=Mauremys mutica TaxID=74926 RepID=A0A9D4ANW6_9SAUR|nr:hypothetical protein KIL84_000977 [Mauremys mutica]